MDIFGFLVAYAWAAFQIFALGAFFIWLYFANDAWGLTLLLYSIATALMVLLYFLGWCVGVDLNRYPWILFVLLWSPSAILLCYQSNHLWRRLRDRRQDAGDD